MRFFIVALLRMTLNECTYGCTLVRIIPPRTEFLVSVRLEINQIPSQLQVYNGIELARIFHESTIATADSLQ